MALIILEERCKGCGLCIEFCPKKVLAFTEKRNQYGYKVIARVDEGKCNHCGFCYLMCPEVVFVEEGFEK
ncbi:MAG: 4Fe-4S binding protein [Thermodesulfobacteriaceae bacterium]|nr:4Fe-4S binding protein [Thermodesulfobacteriaceae bacterium]